VNNYTSSSLENIEMMLEMMLLVHRFHKITKHYRSLL